MKTTGRAPHHEQYGNPTTDEVFGADYPFDIRADRLASVQRVALFAESFFPRYDGVAQHAYNTLRYLQQSGREVLVFAPDTAPQQVGSSRVVPLPSIGVPRYPGLRAGLPTIEIWRQLAQFKPDLIHLFSPLTFSLSGVLYGCRHSLPILANYETNLPRYMAHYGYKWLHGVAKRWMRGIHNLCDLTLVPTPSLLEELGQARFRRLACWTCGINDQRFNPRHCSLDWRNRLLNGRPSSSLLCIYVGRLAPEKSISSLLSVAQLPGVALTIIGDGPQRTQLESQFSGTGTSFTGCLFGDDLARAYASADVFVFPSKTETFGLVTLEAMASGLPVVVSNEGGARDFVTLDRSGILCATAQDFAAAIERLRDDALIRYAMAQQARCAAEAHNYDAIMAQLEDHYRHIQCGRTTVEK